MSSTHNLKQEDIELYLKESETCLRTLRVESITDNLYLTELDKAARIQRVLSMTYEELLMYDPVDDVVVTPETIMKEEPELPYNLTEICIPKSIIRLYKDVPYAGDLPTMTVLYTNGDEE